MSLLGSPGGGRRASAQMARVIRGSRTLQVREREILGELTDALAELIAEETGARPGQVEPWLAAHAVLGLYASLLELARDRVLAGVGGLGAGRRAAPSGPARPVAAAVRPRGLRQAAVTWRARLRSSRPERPVDGDLGSRVAARLLAAGHPGIESTAARAAAGRRGRRGRRGSG